MTDTWRQTEGRRPLGLLESDPPEVALDRLGAREILGLTLGLDVARDLHPLAVRDRFQDAWAEFLTEVVADRPTVVLVEDIHWAEPQLLDLLKYVLGSARGPLLVIATARPELLQRRQGRGARATGELLELDPLSAQDADRMLDEMFAGGLPAELRELIVERAEGNPFFVEVRALSRAPWRTGAMAHGRVDIWLPKPDRGTGPAHGYGAR